MAEPTWDETEPSAPIDEPLPGVSNPKGLPLPQGAIAAAKESASAAPQWDETEPSHASIGPPPSRAQSAAMGLINGAAFNSAPALGGLSDTAMKGITGVIGPVGGGSLDELVDNYRHRRDELHKEFAKAAAAHPTITGVSNALGGMATMGMAGVAAPASVAGQVGQGAAIGAASGAGEGISAGDTVGDIAKKAAVGGTIGGVAAGVIPVMAKNFSQSGLNNIAEKAAVRSINPTAGQMKKLYENEQVTGQKGLGRTLLDEGAITPFSNLEDKAAAVGASNEKAGQQIGDTLKKLDVAGQKGPSPDELVAEIDKIAQPMKNLKTQAPSYKALQDIADDVRTMYKGSSTLSPEEQHIASIGGTEAPPVSSSELEELRKTYLPDTVATAKPLNDHTTPAQPSAPLPGATNDSTGVISLGQGTFDQAQKVKNMLGDQVNWNSPNPTEKDLAVRQVYGVLKDKMEAAAQTGAQNAGDKDLLQNYLKSKTTYGNTSKAQDILKSSVARDAANNRIGLGSTILAGGELAAGHPIKAAATAGAWEAGKAYGNNFVALGADKLSKVLSSAPESFGQFSGFLQKASARGAVSLGATDYILQQINPDYRAQREKVFSGGEQEGE